MKNAYEIRGNVTAIIINSKKYGRIETFISTSKLDMTKEYRNTWYVNWSKNTKSFYVQGTMRGENGERKEVGLHRWITNAPQGMDVDHINHDTLNNTDENLRVCTRSENKQNLKGAQSNNKSSGIRGVTWCKGTEKWKSQIWVNKKLIYIGIFADIKDAEHAAIEARENYMKFSREAS